MSESAALPPDLRDAAAAWRDAEDRLYPLAMSDADAYQLSVALVGMLGEHFEERARCLDDLASAAAQAEAVLRAAAARQGIALAGVDPDQIVGAAAAVRLRTLLALAEGDRHERAIERAREAGLAWAVVEEPAAVATLGGVPMTWVEVHLATGARLVRTIAMDPATGSPRFIIEVAIPEQPQPVMRLELDSRADWIEESDALREALGAAGPPGSGLG